MKDKALEEITGVRAKTNDSVDMLMQRRVRTILLVSSAYDSFIFQQDDRLDEALSNEYLDLHLRFAPRIVRVSTAKAALAELESRPFDLVISMMRVGDMDIAQFGRAVKSIAPDLPVLLLAFNAGELLSLAARGDLEAIDRAFMWLGDVRLFLAMIKSVEDRWNAARDIDLADVHCLLVIEDDIRFYSSYLPMLYTELMEQTLALMSDGLNRMDRLLRQRARHKVLLATSYEEANERYLEYKDHIAAVITDARFPRAGRLDPAAGLDFTRMVRRLTPDRPIVIQSSESGNARYARELGVGFIDKRSPNMLTELQGFLQEQVGFGDFVFRLPGGREIARATDLRSMAELIATVPVESLLYHGNRNDISTWLLARTEVFLAGRIRPARVSDFPDGEALRAYLSEAFAGHRLRSRAGLVAEFSRSTFDESAGIVRLGGGSLGGKGRGLAFMHALIDAYGIEREIPTVSLGVPPTTILATGVFDEFMAQSALRDTVLGETVLGDEEINRRFLDAPFPEKVRRELGQILERVRYPLAVRSSSLLEDASYQPLAGVYRTLMIPNNHPDPDVRLARLCRAVKLVYASTFLGGARTALESAPARLEEEKMAVVIQQVVGRRYGRYYYPSIAGVVHSSCYYPMDGMSAEDGMAGVVLGLGKTVVEGGRCVRFSPAHPRRLYQFSSPDETLRSAQRTFLGLDLMSESDGGESPEGDVEGMHLATLELEQAERDGTLHAVGGVYCPESHAVHDGLSRPGPRLVTMAGVLKHGVMPLPESLAFLSRVCAAAFSAPVEIEFAANLSDDPAASPHELHVLQVRPSVTGGSQIDLGISRIPRDDAVCLSGKVLGNGCVRDVRDVVYVPLRTFDRSRTVEIAREVGAFVGGLRSAGRPVLLIGPGRWGSADRWLGIPVSWSQIAGVRCIVETDMEDIRVQPSEGTHFFHNIVSTGIPYFTVNFDGVTGHLDLDWLDTLGAFRQGEHVRHIAFDEPLEIVVSGRRGQGAILKPGRVIGAAICA